MAKSSVKQRIRLYPFIILLIQISPCQRMPVIREKSLA